MSFGLALYKADGSVYYQSDSDKRIGIVVDIFDTAASATDYRQYSQLVGRTIEVAASGPPSVGTSAGNATVSYPSGVPTVSVGAGSASRSFYVMVT